MGQFFLPPSDVNINLSDITTNNSSTLKHGLLPKLSGIALQYLNGLGNWVTVAGQEFISGVSVANYAALPAAAANSGLMALVLNNSGIWLINFQSKGVYYSDGTTWLYEGDYIVTTTADHIANTPAGNITATNIQAAVNQLDTLKASLSGATFTGLYNTNAFKAGVGHAGIQIIQTVSPGDLVEEGTVDYAGYDSAGGFKQFGSASMMWANTSSTVGYAVYRIHANYGGGTSSNVDFRLFGNQGILLFGTSDTTGPGAKIVRAENGSFQVTGNGVAGVASIFNNSNRLFIQGETGGIFVNNAAGSTTLLQITNAGAITSNSPTGSIGYATGAGGSVNQITSLTTAVTLDKICGMITTVAYSLAPSTQVAFTFNNSTIANTDNISVSCNDAALIVTARTGSTGLTIISIFNPDIVTTIAASALQILFTVNKQVVA